MPGRYIWNETSSRSSRLVCVAIEEYFRFLLLPSPAPFKEVCDLLPRSIFDNHLCFFFLSKALPSFYLIDRLFPYLLPIQFRLLSLQCFAIMCYIKFPSDIVFLRNEYKPLKRHIILSWIQDLHSFCPMTFFLCDFQKSSKFSEVIFPLKTILFI